MAHGKRVHPAENRAPMIRYHSQKQLSLAEFDWPFQTALDKNNRWVKLSECTPWDELAEGYYRDPVEDLFCALEKRRCSGSIMAVGGRTDAVSSAGTTPRRWHNIRSAGPAVLT
ncbi:MAG: hypothetical protein PVI28_10860 [Gammaproteobacteria bacterium]|jgi:hypothetical protein